MARTPPVFAMSAPTADSCRVYNYYVGVNNASACSETPSNWPSGSNNNGNAAGYYYLDNANSGLSHAATYHYDHVNRLSTAAATGNSSYSQSYTYTGDGSNGQYGNMDCSASPAENACLAPTYSTASNHISGYTYDAAGNVTNDGTYTYTWDAEAHLTKVVNGGGTAISTNTYNALGQRVRDVTQTSTTDEAYGAGGELLWRNTGDSNTRSFVPFKGEILAEYYSGGTLFDHYDELGSVISSTSYNGGAGQDSLFYPFGELWTGAGSSGMHRTFAKIPDYDAETDQYNTLNRHYTPSGRWMSPDPGGLKVVKLDDPQTWNMYAYVRNNPTTLTDPTGLDWLPRCMAGLKELVGGMPPPSALPPVKLPLPKPPPLAELKTDMKGHTTTLYTTDANGKLTITQIETRTDVVKGAKPGAGDPYRTHNVEGVSNGHAGDPRFGPKGAFIDTGDSRGRDIHGGGSSLGPHAFDPEQPLRPTEGCTRGHNEDVINLGNAITNFQQANPSVPIPYIRE